MALMHDMPRPGNTSDVGQLWQYVTQLEDMVRYALSHLGSENISPEGITGESIAKGAISAEKMNGGALEGVQISGKLVARVTALEGDMAQASAELAVLPGQISAKADKTTVNGLSTRVGTVELDMDAAKAAIALKASQSDVTALTSRVSQAELDIDGAEADIALKASQTDVTALTSRVNQAEIDIDGAKAQIALKASTQSVNNVINGTTPVEKLETANSEVIIDPYGVEMNGGAIIMNAGSKFEVNSGGKVEVYANDDESYIKFGGTSANPNFSIGSGGNIKCNSITAESLNLNGMQLVLGGPESMANKLIVSTTQPSGHGIVWIQPNSTSMITYGCTVSSYIDMSGDTPTNQTALTFVKNETGESLSGTGCYWGVKFRIYNYDGASRWTRVVVKMYYGTYETMAITILDEVRNEYIRVGDYYEVDTLQNPVYVSNGNLTFLDSPDDLKIKVTLYKDGVTYARFEVNQQFVLQATNNSSQTAQTCNVKYIP